MPSAWPCSDWWVLNLTGWCSLDAEPSGAGECSIYWILSCGLAIALLSLSWPLSLHWSEHRPEVKDTNMTRLSRQPTRWYNACLSTNIQLWSCFPRLACYSGKLYSTWHHRSCVTHFGCMSRKWILTLLTHGWNGFFSPDLSSLKMVACIRNMQNQWGCSAAIVMTSRKLWRKQQEIQCQFSGKSRFCQCINKS